jgi:WD40 repeat protein
MKLRIYEVQPSAEYEVPTKIWGRLMSVIFSPDGAQLLASCDSGVDHLLLWDQFSGTSPTELHGHSDSVNCMTISPDGRLAVSGSEDNTVRVWSLRMGIELLTLRGHFEGIMTGVYSVGFSCDGMRAVSGSSYEIIIWDLTGGVEPLELVHEEDMEDGYSCVHFQMMEHMLYLSGPM